MIYKNYMINNLYYGINNKIIDTINKLLNALDNLNIIENRR